MASTKDLEKFRLDLMISRMMGVLDLRQRASTASDPGNTTNSATNQEANTQVVPASILNVAQLPGSGTLSQWNGTMPVLPVLPSATLRASIQPQNFPPQNVIAPQFPGAPGTNNTASLPILPVVAARASNTANQRRRPPPKSLQRRISDENRDATALETEPLYQALQIQADGILKFMAILECFQMTKGRPSVQMQPQDAVAFNQWISGWNQQNPGKACSVTVDERTGRSSLAMDAVDLRHSGTRWSVKIRGHWIPRTTILVVTFDSNKGSITKMSPWGVSGAVIEKRSKWTFVKTKWAVDIKGGPAERDGANQKIHSFSFRKIEPKDLSGFLAVDYRFDPKTGYLAPRELAEKERVRCSVSVDTWIRSGVTVNLKVNALNVFRDDTLEKPAAKKGAEKSNLIPRRESGDEEEPVLKRENKEVAPAPIPLEEQHRVGVVHNDSKQSPSEKPAEITSEAVSKEHPRKTWSDHCGGKESTAKKIGMVVRNGMMAKQKKKNGKSRKNEKKNTKQRKTM